MKRRQPYSKAERDLAERLYDLAKAQGRLKPPRGLGALSTSNGLRISFACAATTSSDYLGEARRMLARR